MMINMTIQKLEVFVWNIWHMANTNNNVIHKNGLGGCSLKCLKCLGINPFDHKSDRNAKLSARDPSKGHDTQNYYYFNFKSIPR